MQAILEHLTTKYRQYYPEITLISDNNPLYDVIEIDTTDFIDGDYQISLINDNNTLISEEIIRVGTFTNKNKIEYKVEKKFTQYARK